MTQSNTMQRTCWFVHSAVHRRRALRNHNHSLVALPGVLSCILAPSKCAKHSLAWHYPRAAAKSHVGAGRVADRLMLADSIGNADSITPPSSLAAAHAAAVSAGMRPFPPGFRRSIWRSRRFRQHAAGAAGQSMWKSGGARPGTGLALKPTILRHEPGQAILTRHGRCP